MSYSKSVWEQLKGVTSDRLEKALLKDGWIKEKTTGATRPYRSLHGKRIVIHYHPGKTYGSKLLKALLVDIGWSEKEMKKLKLIK